MKKILLWLIFLPFAALTGSAEPVPFYLGGWEQVHGRQFETALGGEMDRAEMDVQSFWKAYDPGKIQFEATAFLKRSAQPGGFWPDDPDGYEIGIMAIRIEGLPSVLSVDSGIWYVVVELSAWGKMQRSGLPLSFQLVMIPGKGFKTPTLVAKRPNQAPEPKAPSNRGSS